MPDNLKPEELEIENPAHYPEWESHLQWMLENHPQYTKELFLKKKKVLKQTLLRVVQRASILKSILREEGNLEPDQIEEVVYAKIVAPSDGPALSPNPPERLPDRLELKILNWAINLKRV